MALLSERDELILSYAQLDARLSSEQLAHKLKLRPHTIQRALKSLIERKIITPYVLINPHALGLTDYCIFFNLTGLSDNSRKKIITLCKQSPYVAYFAELAGEYQYSVSIFAKTIFTVENFLAELTKALPNNAISSTLAIRLSWQLFAHQTFGSKKQTTILKREQTTEIIELDSLDRQFLYYYSRNPSTPILKIAHHLGVTEGTLRNRFQKLQNNQVIIGLPFLVNWSAVGRLALRVLLVNRNMEARVPEELMKFVKQESCVTEVVKCLGSWDMEINFAVKSPVEASVFIQNLSSNFNNSIYSLKSATELAVHTVHQFPEYLLKVN